MPLHTSGFRKIALVATLGLALVVLPLAAGAGSASATSAAIAVVDDATVSSDQATTNFGAALTLDNVSGTPASLAFLKFSVSGVAGTVSKATLRVFTQSSSGSGYELHRVADNTWAEASITYANRPPVGALIGSAVNFTANTWTTVDVTSVVQGNGTFSFEMNATSTNPKKYASKESGANAAQLIVETSTTPTPTPTPTATSTGGSSPATFAAAEDGYVKADQASTNFGSATSLVNTTSPDTHGFIKFAVSGVTGPITKVTFRAFTQSSSGSGYELHRVPDNSWTESALTFGNQPAVGTLIGSAVNFTANTWTSVDATAYVTGNGTYSFEMNATSTNLKQYSSREGANPPQLVVEFSAPASASALTITAGNNQSATVGSNYATPLTVKASDGGGTGVQGVPVTFTAPSSGASGTFVGGTRQVTVTTGASGAAASPVLTASGSAGSFTVTATAPGIASPATFALTNLAPVTSTPTATIAADSYVRFDQPDVNFGSAAVLIGRTSPEIDSYLKFTVTGASQPPVKATLRLWAQTTGTTTYKAYQVTDSSWTESAITFTNKPALGGVLATSGATTSGTWMDLDVTAAVTGDGSVTLGLSSGSTAGKNFASREDAAHAPQLLLTAAPPTNGDPAIVAAGDIACAPADPNYNGGQGTATACHQKATSDLVLSLNPAAVITLGDEQYNSGSLVDFNASYNPTWGRFKNITHPSLGNHELGSTGASGYFNYFGDLATPLQPGCRSNCKAWYSYDVGNWHIITLNTECATNGNNCVAGSEQDLWLQSELAKANAAHQCKLVSTHHPKWTSSSFAASDIDQLVQDMYAGRTDIYLVGHMHGYERFAPQDPAGNLDPANGVTEILAGTGGAFFTGFTAPIQPNSVAHNNTTYGVERLVLHPTSADAQFMRDPTSGLFSDAVTIPCH